MSAAERLRALDEAMRYDAPTDRATFEAGRDAEHAVLRALPAIIAVVEAAERASRHGARMPVSDPPLLPDEMDDVRAALATLSQALEPGDVT